MASSDAEFLAEVEDFLLSCEYPAIGLPNDSHDTIGSESPYKARGVSDGLEVARAKDRKRRHRYRERDRAKREKLQHQVKTLTAELVTRQQTKPVNKSPSTTLWKLLAQHQLNALLEAKEEQRRLCAAINKRTALIHEFQQFVSDRVATVEDYSSDTIPQDSVDTEIFRANAAKLDAAYAQSYMIFDTCGLDSTDGSVSSTWTSWGDDNSGCGGYFQFHEKRTVPFDFNRTCASLWHATHLLDRQENRRQYQGLGDPENTIAVKFRVTTQLTHTGATASVLQRVVVRRYQEGHRMVVVWRTAIEGEHDFAGLRADEVGWGVVTKSSERHTVLRVCARYALTNTQHKKESAVEHFTGVVVEAGATNSLDITSRLDTLLISKAA